MGGPRTTRWKSSHRLAAADSRLRFISEPDEGEVCAVNKGLDMAKGEIFGQQASDDFYVPDAVEAAVGFLLRHPEYIGVGGDGRYVDEAGNDLGRGVITYRGPMCRETIKRILRVRWKANAVCHGSFFGWRERVLRIGKLDPAFSVVPDWEFYLRILDAGERIGCLPKIHISLRSIAKWARISTLPKLKPSLLCSTRDTE